MKKTLSTHVNGVVNMAFSFDGLYLISVGLVGRCYNLQVANWRQGEVISEVQASPEPILDVIVNPYNRETFATCGKNRIQIWRLKSRNLFV
jgi:WD40 repeat protein